MAGAKMKADGEQNRGWFAIGNGVEGRQLEHGEAGSLVADRDQSLHTFRAGLGRGVRHKSRFGGVVSRVVTGASKG